jgi:predicted dehydrogenase
MIGLQNRATPVISQVRDMVAKGHLGEVLSTTMNVSAQSGTQVDQANAYLTDIRNGANMLTIALGQCVDALNYSLGEWQDLSAVLANRIPELTVIETGEAISKTAHDQAAVIGTLKSGATASVHCRSTAAHEDSFHWEVNGSEGHLVVTAPGGSPGIFPLTVRHRAKGDSELRQLPIALPQTEGIPAGSPANNVALMYGRLANDLRENTRTVPNFEDALTRHRMLATIETAANTGTRQSYEARTAE